MLYAIYEHGFLQGKRPRRTNRDLIISNYLFLRLSRGGHAQHSTIVLEPSTTSRALCALVPGKQEAVTPKNPGLSHSASVDNISVSGVMTMIYHINHQIGSRQIPCECE